MVANSSEYLQDWVDMRHAKDARRRTYKHTAGQAQLLA